MSKKLLAIILVISMFISCNPFVYALGTDYITQTENVSLSISRNIVKIQTNVELNSARLVLSSYENGILLDLKVLNITALAGSTTELPIPNDLEISDVGFIKAMLWNSLDDCMPVATSSSYALSAAISSMQLESVSISSDSDYISIIYRLKPEDRYVFIKLLDLANLKVYVNDVLVQGTADYMIQNIIGKGCFYGNMVLARNGDSNYDFNTVYITDYKTIVVGSHSSTTIFPYNDVASLTYSNLNGTIDATLYDTAGNEMNWADLKQLDVVSYTMANDGTKTIVKGWLINNIITGTARSISTSGEEVIYNINGIEYGIANSLSSDDISLGDSGVFYLDILGNIVFSNTTNPIYSNYAYIIDVKAVDWFAPTLLVKLCKANGTTGIYEVNSRINLDGIPINAGDMIDSEYNIKDVSVNYSTDLETLIKKQGTEYFSFNSENTAVTAVRKIMPGQFVSIGENSSGAITSIDRPKSVYNSTDGKGMFSQFGTEFAQSVFNEGDMSLTAGASKLYITDYTVIMVAPEGCTDESKYEIISSASLQDEEILNDVSFYNVNEDREIGAVVINKLDSLNTFIIANSLPGTTINCEGDTVGVISGMRDGEILPENLITTPDVDVSNINIGTVFIPLLNGKGEVEAINLLSSADDFENKVVPTQSTLEKNMILDGKVYYYYGNIAGIDARTITLFDKPDDPSDDLIIAGNKVTSFSVGGATNLYLYDERQSSLRRVADSSDFDLSDLHVTVGNGGNYIYTDDSDSRPISNMAVFAREYDGDIIDAVIYIFD